MPAHVLQFPVRYHECDAYHHVNHANYVRYMAEAAFSASAKVGYTEEKLKKTNAVWLVRGHNIEFVNPYTFGDQVKIETWVTNFRRVRSLRQYVFWKGNQVAARASTDWVYADRQTGQLLTVPDQMAADFLTYNGPDDRPQPKLDPFPKPAPYPEAPFSCSLAVEWRDVDPNRHVNNAAYLSYIENAAWQMCVQYGWTPQRMVEHNFGIVARRYRIEYLAPAWMGDQLQITTWVSDGRRATAVRHYEVRRAADQKLLARARALWVWVNLQTGLPIRIPRDFWEDFQPNISAGTPNKS
ncbi:MAG: acyl-CoA thioesterase [Ardenticatenaceae bacterium]|nr:acyl-CoA thioesterase [Ardenticatenaceae bacterium]